MKRTKSKQPGIKLFVVRKYIAAKSAAEAIRRDRATAPDEVFIDDDWRKNNRDSLAEAIGFGVERKDSDDQ